MSDAGGFHRRDGADGGLIVEQQHLLETDVADFGCRAEDGASRGRCHLAEGGPRQSRRVVQLVVVQPGVRHLADLALPDVAFRVLLQRTCAPISGCTATVKPPRAGDS